MRGVGIAITLVVWLGLAGSAQATPAELFARAGQEYDAGDYARAALLYDSLRREGFGNAAVYFNLGNAYFRAGDVGRAIWAYRTAGHLAPRDPDIEANLTVARLSARDRIEAVTPGFTKQVWRAASGLLSLREGSRLVSLLWVALWFVIAIWLFYPRLRHIINPLLKPLVVLWAAAALILLARYLEVSNTLPAVVVAAETEALSGPGGDADVVFSGHAGLECVVRGERADYFLVELANGRVGWVPAADLALIGT
jgi:tetratricopeptide (TPR) repeat protein